LSSKQEPASGISVYASIPASDENDTWTYIWGSGFFSCSRAYRHLEGHRDIPFNWIRRSSCQLKHKNFIWLLLKDRFSTRDILRRRNMTLPDFNSVNCASLVVETREHLFLACGLGNIGLK